MKNWIKISEKLPKDVTPVLVYGECCDVCYQIKIAEIEQGEWFESGHGEDLKFKPTHWMPLPDVPSIKPDKWFIVAVHENGTAKKVLETPFNSSSKAKEDAVKILNYTPILTDPQFYRWIILTEEEYLEYEKNGIDLTKRNKR
jgi:hypothetical protein